MIKYKQVYLDGMGFDETDFIPSEISDQPAVDIHHIVTREDRIENLMALSRSEHLEYGDRKWCMAMLLRIHRKHLIGRKRKFDNNWFRKWIRHYEPYEINQ